MSGLLKYDTQVSASNSDITIKSIDGVHFKLHRKNLASHSDGFPAENMVDAVQDEVVNLSETAETLELLFQYMYPPPWPYLWGLPASALFSLAEAAEKYVVSSTIAACKPHLRF
jgi:hypothetical protein